jgi:hypothetical protein
MSEYKYIKNDLSFYSDEDKIDELQDATDYGSEPLITTRKGALIHVLPEDADVYVSKVGSYQGDMCIIVLLDDYYWFTNDNYGSCRGCDFYLSDPKEWTEQQLREFYCFENIKDMKNYVINTDSFHYYREDELRATSINLIEDKIQ